MLKYDVYENGKLILKSVTANEIKEALTDIDLPNSLRPYVERGIKIKGKYSIAYAGSNPGPIVTDDISAEWARVVAMFKNVIWVKSGGRKLTINGGKKENDER